VDLTRLGSRDDMRAQQEYIDELRSRAEDELNNVDLGAIFGSVDTSKPWAIFQACLDAVQSQTAAHIEPHWISRHNRSRSGRRRDHLLPAGVAPLASQANAQSRARLFLRSRWCAVGMRSSFG
jgi:hypothetical protein